MHIEDFKTWHWMVLGPIIGLLVGCVLLWRGPSSDVAGIETLDQGRFERAASGTAGRRPDERLLSDYCAGTPWLKDVVVHPPIEGDSSGTYWVLGKYLSADYGKKNPDDPISPEVVFGNWIPFRYPAKAPYNAFIGAQGVYQNVMAYLDALRKNSPNSSSRYRFAWWDSTAAMLGLPAMAGFLIIGVAWPMTIQLLQGTGLSPVPQPKVKLPKSRPVKAKKAAVDHSAGDRRLDEMNTQMEQDLAAGASTGAGSAVTAATGEAPVKALTGGPAETAAAAERERLIREYGGEFYPVVRSVHKESEENDQGSGSKSQIPVPKSQIPKPKSQGNPKVQ